ncbi:hypothetical protein BK010_09695 [Tenericutes bacterium MO-XQ]|nr:hypothetical protein BK010_09695 [Tenericutes bacterium MO-XQ]
MRIPIFIKTFLLLLISFSIVFFINIYISYQRFSPMYIEENIESVKTSILNSVNDINNNLDLNETDLKSLSSETEFIRIENNEITDTIGPDYLSESDILDFVINIFDNEETIKEGQLMYHATLVEDVHQINYIYQYEAGDYLIVSTRIQNLQNIDRVLNNINITQSIYILVAITLLSIFISYNISRPIHKINRYAKDISNLNFKNKLNLNRKDEFKDLVSSLNEMTFNLKKTYTDLNEANQKLSSDIDFEKEQEQKKKELIMMINHEIKTPLAVMKGMIEGMIDGVGRYKDKEKYLGELLTQIEAIESITKDLTYSLRLEDKMKTQDITHTNTILKQLKPLKVFASQHQIEIQENLLSSDLMMSEELLSILITNLIKNAVLYSEDKFVKVEGYVDHNHYVLIVKNKGYIPEAEIDKLFNSFYRIKKQHEKTSGSGLGLFIVKQICDLYGYTYKLFNDNGYVTAKIHIQIKI